MFGSFSGGSLFLCLSGMASRIPLHGVNASFNTFMNSDCSLNSLSFSSIWPASALTGVSPSIPVVVVVGDTAGNTDIGVEVVGGAAHAEEIDAR